MDKWIIIDWANNHCYPQMEFDTFEDGWDWIYENVDVPEDMLDEDNKYDDLYVVDKYSWIPNFSKYPKFER